MLTSKGNVLGLLEILESAWNAPSDTTLIVVSASFPKKSLSPVSTDVHFHAKHASKTNLLFAIVANVDIN